MDRNCRYLLTGLLIAAIALCGCTSSPASAPAITQTQTPPAVNVTVTVTVTPTATPLPAYTLSPACQLLADGLDDDTAYLQYVNDSAIVSRIEDLSYNCNVADGSLVNQLILKGPKPRSESLLKNRDYLILATTYCQAPNTAAHTRTRDALKTSETKLAEYSEALDSCEPEFQNVITPVKSASPASAPGNPPASTTISGTGDDVVSFNTTSTGLRIFTMQYSGNAGFTVQLKDEQGDPVILLVNETGPYSGKHSEKLSSGRYYLDITADGQWNVSIE